MQPKYTEDDLNAFIDSEAARIDAKSNKLVVHLCNLLYRIELDDRDRKLLRRTLRKNKELLAQLSLKRADVNDSVMETVKQALVRKYQSAGMVD